MRYEGMVIRPPSEANSYILQVTYGCSHNRCTFCGTYADKPFRARPIQEVLEDVALAQARNPRHALRLPGGRKRPGARDGAAYHDPGRAGVRRFPAYGA